MATRAGGDRGGGGDNSDASRDPTTFEVREALGQPGCAICHLTIRSVGRLMQSIAYEQINDIQLRTELRSARGFCNAHAHRWLREVRSVLGTAIVYRDVLMASARELEGSVPRSNAARGSLLSTLLGGNRAASRNNGCVACREQRQAEKRYVETLLPLLAADENARTALAASEGVCRRHVRLAVRRGGPGAELVVQQTLRSIERSVRELDEVIRKEDYRFRHEPRTDEERTVPARAVTWAAGETDGLVETD